MEELLTIDSVYSKEESHTVLVNFQNGEPEDDLDVDCKRLVDENGNKSLVTEISDVLYAGDEDAEDLGQTFILVRNRKTGKVRLIEVGCAELKPVIKIDLDTSQLHETSRLELSRKFGSKKQKQQMEQKEKLKVNVQTVTEQMVNVTENISEDKLDLSVYNQTNSDDFYLPPIDRDATKVEEVYDLNKILTEDEYEAIYSELEDKDYADQLHSSIKRATASKKMTPRLTVLSVYADTLLKFTFIRSTEVRKKSFTVCEHSSTLNKIVLNNFTTLSNGKRNRPLQYRDKSICYFIVFMLILNNFKFDMENLSSALKMTPATIGLKVRVVGGSVVTSGDKKMVQLKLPLVSKTAFRRKSAKF
ncbi:hypothetical protein MSG28_016117 [Choristoneura fumiferana]|uniref:Uncharacterized protein n=1 Tax=Choristoneura fumiferana TaxID=7141 RepID=A0ACC0K5F1_CHOFU|nr:hypothetical protein MSG28_016117 [Choristoneura fumiferana]